MPSLVARLALVSVSILCTPPFAGLRCSAQELPRSYAVEGTVLDSVSHQPIARALVDATNDAVLTDSEGRFELHLPAGMYRIRVRRPGYSSGRLGVQEMFADVHVSEKTPPPTFYLTPAASIVAEVTLGTGEQADGLSFMLYRKQIFDGRPQWMPSGNATTNSEGVLRFVEIGAPGAYIFCSEPSPDSNITPQTDTKVLGYPGLCFPGGTDLNSAIAAPLHLRPGQQAQLDISLPHQPFYPVSISIAGGLERGSVQIFDRSGRGVNAPMNLDQRSGSLKTVLPNGSYYAEVRTWGQPQLYGRVSFTVAGAPLTGLTLVATPVQPIPVEVRQEFTMVQQQGAGSRIFSGNDSSESRIGVSVRAADDPTGGQLGINLRHSPSSPEGLDEMEFPVQGSFWLQAQAYEPGVYISSMTSGNTDLFREPLAVGSGNSTLPIEITLRNDVGRLHCKVKAPPAASSLEPTLSDEAPTRVFVYAIPQSPNQLRIYESLAEPLADPRTTLNMHGVLRQEALPPGSYLVVAFDHLMEIDLDDKEAMAELAAHGQTVTIQPGVTTELEVEPMGDTEAEAAAQ